MFNIWFINACLYHDHQFCCSNSNSSDVQVLGGTARRRKLLSPKGMDVRPMMEVVKGAAFGILQVMILFTFNLLIMSENFVPQLIIANLS